MYNQRNHRTVDKEGAPGYDFITVKVLKELPRKGLLAITQNFHAVMKTQHVPVQWKFGQVIVIQSLECHQLNVALTDQFHSLLHTLVKLIETFILRRLTPIVEAKRRIRLHSLGYCLGTPQTNCSCIHFNKSTDFNSIKREI